MKSGSWLVLSLCSCLSAAWARSPRNAQFPWMTSYNKPGHINVYGGVGYYWAS